MLPNFDSEGYDTPHFDASYRSATTVWKVDPLQPEARIVEPAATLVSEGGVVIYPTETFYGLGGHPKLRPAVERIYRIKGREFSKPLPLIASSLEAVHQAVAEWPAMAERLSLAFWPGPLTLVLPAAPHILPLIHGYTGSIAVRISSHPVAQALAAGTGGLLIATSANRAHRQAYQTPAEIPSELLSQVDGLLDAGPTGGDFGKLASTIVDVRAFPPRLIRAGCIPWERLVRALD
jgi:L-threonylcarbamoyladenylate synthase